MTRRSWFGLALAGVAAALGRRQRRRYGICVVRHQSVPFHRHFDEAIDAVMRQQAVLSQRAKASYQSSYDDDGTRYITATWFT